MLAKADIIIVGLQPTTQPPFQTQAACFIHDGVAL